MLAIISVVISSCFSSETGNSATTVSTQKSNNTVFQQSSNETITDCFLGFKFGMSQYEVAKHTESFHKGENGYEGKCDFNGHKDCLKFKMNGSYIYALPNENFCEYYKGKSYYFSFFIDVKDFYSFVDFYKNSEEKYEFSPSDNNEEVESYNFNKENLLIHITRVKKKGGVVIAYINKPILYNLIEERNNVKSE